MKRMGTRENGEEEKGKIQVQEDKGLKEVWRIENEELRCGEVCVDAKGE